MTIPNLTLLWGILLGNPGVPPTQIPASHAYNSLVQAACPAAAEASLEVVSSLASSAEHAHTRQDYGIPTASATDIRLLTDPADTATCEKLGGVIDAQTAIPSGQVHRSYYRVGGHYYVVFTPVSNKPETLPPGAVWVDLRWTPLYVYDSNLTHIAGIAM